MTNHFHEDSQIDIGKSNLMPYLVIENHRMQAINFDIWDETNTTVDVSKLRNYFEPVIVKEERVPGNTIKVMKPMRKCSLEDFEKRKFKP